MTELPPQGWTPSNTNAATTTQVGAKPIHQTKPEFQLPPIAELPKFRGGHLQIPDNVVVPANRPMPFPQPTWAYDKDEYGRKTGQMHVVLPIVLIDEAPPVCWYAIGEHAWLFVLVFSTSANLTPSSVLIRLEPDDVSPTFPPIGGQDPYDRTRCLHIAAVNQWRPKTPKATDLPALQESYKLAQIQEQNAHLATAGATAGSVVQGEVVQ